jgi:hypothetical protein
VVQTGFRQALPPDCITPGNPDEIVGPFPLAESSNELAFLAIAIVIRESQR